MLHAAMITSLLSDADHFFTLPMLFRLFRYMLRFFAAFITLSDGITIFRLRHDGRHEMPLISPFIYFFRHDAFVAMLLP